MRLPLILIAGMIVLAPSHMFAQERFFLGVTGGASSTHLSGDVPAGRSYTSKAGFSAGIIAEYAFWDDIRITVQPSYARRGTGVAFDVGEIDPRDSLAISLDYLSIPIMARFLTAEESWFVNGGVELAFLLDASVKNIVTEAKADVKSMFNDVDLMMLFGVGKNFRFEPVTLSLELRYGQSILNAASTDQLAEAIGMSPRFRSSGFQLLVAVVYPL